MAEKDLEAKCRRLAESLGGRLLKLELHSEKGFPDRTLFLNGKVSFLEFKTPIGSASPHQRRFAKRLLKEGHGHAFISDERGFSEVLRLIHGVTNHGY